VAEGTGAEETHKAGPDEDAPERPAHPLGTRLPPRVTPVLLDLEVHGSPPPGEIITARGVRPIR
jgi:hypothetical protein